MSCAGVNCSNSSKQQPLVADFLSRSALRIPPPLPFAAFGRAHARWRQRQTLLELDDRLLNDIGISRADALREARRPFWK
jgi:uncharacterized protein YjiS (DUF1127 family)